MTAPTEDLIARIETEVRAWESTRDDGSSGLAFEALLTEAAQALRALQQEVERLREVVELSAKHSPIDTKAMFGIRDRARSALTGSAQG